MKVLSFNVNGLRARLHQLRAVIEAHDPDFIGLQETKVEDDLFPLDAIRELGYQASYHGQRGHYGVALLYRDAPIEIACGFPGDGEDVQRRLVRGTFATDIGKIHIYNGYFPQGESRKHPLKFPAKRQFYRNLATHLASEHQPDENILVIGDMNVAPQDNDIGIGEDNRKRWLSSGKCCFLPEEREWLGQLVSWGLIDSFQQMHKGPGEQRYSWFDYRSRGFERDPKRGLRIDLILASAPLAQRLAETGIDQQVRAMEKPSDHCPVWASFRSK